MLGPEHPSVAIAYNNLGNIYRSQGKLEEALGAYSKALEIRLKVLGPEHPDVVRQLGDCLLQPGQARGGARGF